MPPAAIKALDYHRKATTDRSGPAHEQQRAAPKTPDAVRAGWPTRRYPARIHHGTSSIILVSKDVTGEGQEHLGRSFGWLMFVSFYGMAVGVYWSRRGRLFKAASWCLGSHSSSTGWGFSGLTAVNPHDARSTLLVSKARSSTQGWWVNPLTNRRRLLRIRNFERQLKVVTATATRWDCRRRRLAHRRDVRSALQQRLRELHACRPGRRCAISRPAIRTTRTRGTISLLSAGGGREASSEIQERLSKGHRGDRARISHLACAPEIAGAMLRRRQAAPSSPRGRGSSRARSAW